MSGHLTPLQRARRETESALVAFQIAAGLVKVTRCAEHRRTNLNPRRGGGMMPAHLNPLTMGEHDHGGA